MPPTILLLLSLNVSGSTEEPPVITLTAGHNHYRSFSQQDNSFPMKTGYPVLSSGTLFLEGLYRMKGLKGSHIFGAMITFPGGLQSDNGTGNDFLLKASESRYFHGRFSYFYNRQLYSLKNVELHYSIPVGIASEYRKLVYLSDAVEQTQDMGVFLGPPGAWVTWNITEKLKLWCTFHPVFHLPWLNYGVLKKYDPAEHPVSDDTYRAFYYHTMLKAAVQYDFFTLGLMKNDLAGFGSRKPDFNTSEMVHYKLDKVLQVYLSVDL